MNPITEFLLQNFVVIYFVYGLSFFSMGLAILLEVGHSEIEFARALKPLAAFGLIHGSHEWFEMFLLIEPKILESPLGHWIGLVRVILLAASFIMLVIFGARLIAGASRGRLQLQIMMVVAFVWMMGLLWVISTQPSGKEQIVASDVYTRYALAIPGAALTAWGLLNQRRWFIHQGMPGFGRDVTIAALAFMMYGGIGQLFASSSGIFPSPYLNSEVFIQWFGFPVQLLRAAMACIAAIFIIHSLRAFEVENRRRIDALREAQLTERRHLETVRAELLHRTVKAQETERQRIARELHDETGQTLTALGMGLRGLSETIPVNPQKAVQQAKHLESLTIIGLDGLSRMVKGLHPPQLDDFGLLPALRWYVGEVSESYHLPITITYQGDEPALSTDVRAVFYRIAQEAINNIVRHANANHASLEFITTDRKISMIIQDDGDGFAVITTMEQYSQQPHWGVLGMIERARLVGATCEIDSEPGKGTRVEVIMPLEEINHV